MFTKTLHQHLAVQDNLAIIVLNLAIRITRGCVSCGVYVLHAGMPGESLPYVTEVFVVVVV